MTDKKETILKLIPQQGMLPLYFNKDADISIGILHALYAAGIKTIEYTNRGEQALQNFARLREICDKELGGMYLGVGTIKTAAQAQAFVDAGADYIISPGLVEEVIPVADKAGLLWIPGAMTATEIIRAENLGAKLVKLFPGNLLGPGFMSAIKELFPVMLFMPTGGVELSADNLGGWFKAGVCAVGMGSKLITKDVMENKKYNELTAATIEALAIVNANR
ncbi:bifunctional 4-hydroxy-2-oxoglutarate aldolase/2-dehydro-3-deoxy-phosphogluconate aldolase [Mucilaginibacter myungsuensis]|uniref:Bifunctional 4-hydroxy-2-oxoglutarate aldolase/2-dehydro-3-deoxy-phosphogluconate aldolase n=1 Tax=Mucilaginibacter myungsuensis TaxID=649104 RepID=A0A929L268_9SPHI|nr:bifunctional 4-hydroxy-2-oxoglutarate aldolase/2-dehydro-3-deoxy-phosphogluconate aldolase [Mucilaginibacter myungsuensis]MBE9661876.1 bifunctional 4-hydroxy-2-oxoglutarate aldolase/2-dehydro-3-deoxy-phosphogluconate aldolase [Mucilaginibacter myungsuensis]MDN3599690.1 bifunctional 4-hydroxy-2-oxoglutarate aldolase/2-dehydro-3-deoxy-phosphogluconate aldolase [Mucilaginibacter myungsuensis]